MEKPPAIEIHTSQELPVALMVGMENQIQLGKSLDIYIEACMRVKNWVKPSSTFTGDDEYTRLPK